MSFSVVESTVRADGGVVVPMSTWDLVYFHDNSSLNGEDTSADNYGKNTNVHSAATVKKVALSYSSGVHLETTPMLSCPVSRSNGEPDLWLDTYYHAADELVTEQNVRPHFDVESFCLCL